MRLNLTLFRAWIQVAWLAVDEESIGFFGIDSTSYKYLKHFFNLRIPPLSCNMRYLKCEYLNKLNSRTYIEILYQWWWEHEHEAWGKDRSPSLEVGWQLRRGQKFSTNRYEHATTLCLPRQRGSSFGWSFFRVELGIGSHNRFHPTMNISSFLLHAYI